MLERAFKGSRRYWGWLAAVGLCIALGFVFYLRQLWYGLGITGMGRDVSWGLYIANFTFLVGVAASAVMVVLPYYLHDYKAFGRVTVFGEFLAVAAVVMAILFIFVDLGQPARVFNVLLFPSPGSVLFWDMVVLTMYLILNIVIGWRSLEAERRGVAVARWVRPLIFLSIPAAISIHTITAFIYAGLGARPFWLTALLAPRFLASAFASGPSILVLLLLVARKLAGFDAAHEAIRKLCHIVAYALSIHIFFLMVEIFTVFYSGIPDHSVHFRYLFGGLEGRGGVAVSMWAGLALAVGALALLLLPGAGRNQGALVAALTATIVAVWIEKGPGLVIPGFVPSPLGEVARYVPTLPEILISLGVYAVGALILSMLFKIALSVKGGRKA